MPSSIAHAAVAVIANPVLEGHDRTRGLIWLAGAAAAAPDLDTVGWVLHGADGPLSAAHRGVTHSLAVAVAGALIGVALLQWHRSLRSPARTFAYLALVIASHGALDCFVSYGPGVALLAPFAGQRLKAPWRVFDGLLTEIVCLWLPALIFIVLDIGGFRSRSGAPSADSSPSRSAG